MCRILLHVVVHLVVQGENLFSHCVRIKLILYLANELPTKMLEQILLLSTIICRFLLLLENTPDIVTVARLNGIGAADCVDVGAGKGETGALNPPRDMSSSA